MLWCNNKQKQQKHQTFIEKPQWIIPVLILLLGAEVTGGVTADSEVEDSVKGQRINVSSIVTSTILNILL